MFRSKLVVVAIVGIATGLSQGPAAAMPAVSMANPADAAAVRFIADVYDGRERFGFHEPRQDAEPTYRAVPAIDLQNQTMVDDDDDAVRPPVLIPSQYDDEPYIRRHRPRNGMGYDWSRGKDWNRDSPGYDDGNRWNRPRWDRPRWNRPRWDRPRYERFDDDDGPRWGRCPPYMRWSWRRERCVPRW